MHKLNTSQEVKFLPSESKEMNAVYEMYSGFSDMKGGICCSYLKQKINFFLVGHHFIISFFFFFRYESQLNTFILFNILFLLLFTFVAYI